MLALAAIGRCAARTGLLLVARAAVARPHGKQLGRRDAAKQQRVAQVDDAPRKGGQPRVGGLRALRAADQDGVRHGQQSHHGGAANEVQNALLVVGSARANGVQPRHNSPNQPHHRVHRHVRRPRCHLGGRGVRVSCSVG